jgi:hypothetical protein
LPVASVGVPALKNLRAVEQHGRIDAKIPADQADDDDGADAEPAGAARHAAAAARGAQLPIVLDIVAFAEIIGAHLSFSFAFLSRGSFAVTRFGTNPLAAHRRLTKCFPAFIA